MITVDLCSVSAGKTKGLGMLLNMAGRLMLEVVILALGRLGLGLRGWRLRVAAERRPRNIKGCYLGSCSDENCIAMI